MQSWAPQLAGMDGAYEVSQPSGVHTLSEIPDAQPTYARVDGGVVKVRAHGPFRHSMRMESIHRIPTSLVSPPGRSVPRWCPLTLSRFKRQ